MGTPADDTELEYEEGAECAACVDILFNGKTPLTVKVVFEGLQYEDYIDPQPTIPTAWTLIQQVDKCWWSGTKELEGFTWLCDWHINVVGQEWDSKLALDIEGVPAFFGQSESKCIAGFENEFTEGSGFGIFGGTGVIRWGMKVE